MNYMKTDNFFKNLSTIIILLIMVIIILGSNVIYLRTRTNIIYSNGIIEPKLWIKQDKDGIKDTIYIYRENLNEIK